MHAHHPASRLRLLALGLLALAASLVVAACGGGDGGGSGNKTTITFLAGQEESTRLEAQR